MPAAFGCVRFSSDKQEDGDSIRRQREKVLGWIDRNRGRLELDSTLGEGGFYTDRGMTGFATTGEERETLSEDYALGQLIRHAESGRIPAGSFLVVESADRLSRESAVHALHIITGLLKRKLVVVTLSPEAEYRADADLLKLFGLGITTERAHDESRIKSIRGRAVWEAKRATAADHPLTRIVPSWCKLVGARTVGGRLVGGEIREDRAKSEVVRRLFVLARSGLGTRSIANQLNEEGVPVVGRGKRWTETAVYHILTTPTVTGEFQPHTGRTGNSKKGRPETRKPAGAAVAGYYPRGRLPGRVLDNAGGD